MINKIYNFRIEYGTTTGQTVRVVINSDHSFKNDTNIYVECKTSDGYHWNGKADDLPAAFYYKYEVLKVPDIIEEVKRPRFFDSGLYTTKTEFYFKDHWRPQSDANNIFYSAAFSEVIFKPDTKKKKSEANTPSAGNLSFRLNAPNIPKDKNLGITGNIQSLGNWEKAIALNNSGYPEWNADVFCHNDVGTVEYKYVLMDCNSRAIIYWEHGENRRYTPIHKTKSVCEIIHDEGFKYEGQWWRGSGIAIPVFSLRSKSSCGIGEFTDLKLLTDLNYDMGMNIIQTLPVNDTIANKSWTDSYPYAAISVYALHPLYLHLDTVDDLSKYDWYPQFIQDREKLNGLDTVDFEAVLSLKMDILQKIYKKQGSRILKSKVVKDFIAANDWVRQYSVFCYLRDQNKTPEFYKWKEHAVYTPETISKYWAGDQPIAEVGFFTFIQYYLDKQLKEVKAYGRSKGIVLKGDLPIGIYRYSCDAWTHPHLFNMDQQAGAPPDDYAVNGQNWGFPTYNWEEMSKDGYLWWKSRMLSLATYFDALRIDHILGFFRIWSIPVYQISGTLGLFYPRLPLHLNELASYGLKGDINRYTKPFIRLYMLKQMFGDQWESISNALMVEVFADAFVFKPEFDTQTKLAKELEKPEYQQIQNHTAQILALLTEVILIEEPGSGGLYFNPRITLQTTYSYRDLDDYTKKAVDRLYVDYFYKRHNEFWKEKAFQKLPAIIKASDMLICGEDLGMIPATVPEVMSALHIIPLEIQRMPKSNTLFGQCREYEYMSVCSPSCHDMSTIRGWWEGNTQTAQNFYHLYMGVHGQAPRQCTAEIVRYIVQDHLDSKSILAVFPMQDLLGMDDQLKHPNPFAEQINEPANPKHYWRYRMHLFLEDVLADRSFVDYVKGMVRRSGR
jgi:4-alpha-glucanotransferase